MPATRASSQTRGRRAALVVCAVALGSTAACTTTPGDTRQAGASTNTSSTLAAPWQGSLTTASLGTGVQSLTHVSCASALRCWAVGSTAATGTAPSGPVLVASVDGGASWKSQSLPAGIGYLSGIACATTKVCTAVGQVGTTGVGPGAVLTTTTGGATWTSEAVPAGTTDVTAVACRTGGGCTALGTVAGRVTTLVPTGTTGAWTATGALPAVASVATSLACTDALDCWATASDTVDASHAVGSIDTTTDGGTTWVPQTVPVGTGAINAVDCSPPVAHSTSTVTYCTAVGTTSTVPNGARTGQAVVLTWDGGTSWSSQPVPAGSADLLSVSCGAGPCVAVGANVATAPQGGVVVLTPATGASGTVWRRAAAEPVALPLTGVSCVSLAACAIVGESVSAHLSAA